MGRTAKGMGCARRSMCRGGRDIDGGGAPLVGAMEDERRRGRLDEVRQAVVGLVQDPVLHPHHDIVSFERRAIVILRMDVMRLQVPMNGSLCVVSVRGVPVFLLDGRWDHVPWQQDRSDKGSEDAGRHSAIMSGPGVGVNFRPARSHEGGEDACRQSDA